MNREGLSRVVTIANSKGGVGKTGCAVHLAGLSASAGWRTLFVDLDPQGDAGRMLGYAWADLGDQGQHLVSTLVAGQPLTPALPAVRPNLDVVPGGEALNDLDAVVTGRVQRSAAFETMLAEALAPTAGEYDLVVIDTPPTRPVLLQLALGATRWLIVPTRPGRNSILGLAGLAREIVTARRTNPRIEILGAVLFDVETTATVIRRNAIADIGDALDGAAPLFDTVIRHATSAAVAAEERGLLVHELAEEVENAEPYWRALKEGRRPDRLPGSAPALAEDYLLLCQEVLLAIDRREAAAEQVTA